MERSNEYKQEINYEGIRKVLLIWIRMVREKWRKVKIFVMYFGDRVRGFGQKLSGNQEKKKKLKIQEVRENR